MRMNPVLLGILLVGVAVTIGVILAARSGMLKQALRRSPLPPLDLANPLVQALSVELYALDALPISTKQERRVWFDAAGSFDKKLRTEWASIYDSLPHELEHYLVDTDIRAKDTGYANYQRNLLAALLKTGREQPTQRQ